MTMSVTIKSGCGFTCAPVRNPPFQNPAYRPAPPHTGTVQGYILISTDSKDVSAAQRVKELRVS